MKSSFIKSKIKNEDLKDLHALSFKYVLNESIVLWQLSQVFLLGNTVLSGFIVAILSPNANHNNLGIFLLASMGILVSILWLFSYSRTSKYYEFRIAQAKQREPKNWMLFNEDGEYFSQGDTLEIEGKRHSFWLWRLSSLLIIKILAVMFVIFYLIVIVFFVFNFKFGF